MSEAVVLDPTAVATGRIEVDITDWIGPAGPDWGDAAIEQYLAEAQRGQLPVDFRVPNRQIQIPLLLLDRPAATFAQMRRSVQAKAALFQQEGGWLSRVVNGIPWYADIVGASLKLGGSTMQALWGIDADAVLTLDCLPDFYGDEITLDSMSTTAAELVGVLKQGGVNAKIAGDYPARCRIVVTDTATVARFGLLWAWRSRHYKSASTAALAYEAEALTPLDTAAVATLAGASGGGSNNVVRHTALAATAWTPVLSTTILSGTAAMTHTGSYRVWVRAYTASVEPPRLRLVWDTGDMNAPVENAPKYLPASAGFYDLDLGEVRLDAAPVGTHRWSGQIQGRGGSGANVYIDKVWFVPVDEGYGLARMTSSSLAGAIAARDDFTGTSSGAALNTRTPPVGAAWATSGAANDFAFLDAGGLGQQLPASEAVGRSDLSGSLRFGVLGSAMTDQQVAAGLGVLAPTTLFSDTGECGAVARFTDANNHLRFTATFAVSNGGSIAVSTAITKVVGGTATVIASRLPEIGATGSLYLTLVLLVSVNGTITARLYSISGRLVDEIITSDPALATGGALASGKAGLVDSGHGTNVVQRWYDDIVVSVPPPEPVVLNSGRSSELRWNGHYRQTIDGAAYDQINYVVGDLPRLPPSGLEDRPVELFVKPSRGDFDQRADTGIDAISAQVKYRPSYLSVPAS